MGGYMHHFSPPWLLRLTTAAACCLIAKAAVFLDLDIRDTMKKAFTDVIRGEMGRLVTEIYSRYQSKS